MYNIRVCIHNVQPSNRLGMLINGRLLLNEWILNAAAANNKMRTIANKAEET